MGEGGPIASFPIMTDGPHLLGIDLPAGAEDHFPPYHGFRLKVCGSLHEAQAALETACPDLVVSSPGLLAADPAWRQVAARFPEIPWISMGTEPPRETPGLDALTDMLPWPPDAAAFRRLANAAELSRARKRISLLHRAESKLDLILANAPDVIYSLDAEGLFTTVSHSIRMLGYTPADIIGKSVFPIIHPEDRDRVAEGFRKSIRDGETEAKTIEFRMRAKDGSYRLCEVNRRLIFENGRFVESQGVARDLTRLKRANEQMRAIVSVSPSPFLVSRLSDGRILYANEPMSALCGLGSGELLGRPAQGLLHDPQEAGTLLSGIVRDGSARYRDVLLRKGDGAAVWVQISLMAADLEGESVLVCGFHDIHLRKLAEEGLEKARVESEALVRLRTAELAVSNAAMKALLDAIPDSVFRLDWEGNIVDYHAPGGADGSDWIGRNISGSFPGPVAELILDKVEDAFQTGEMQELEFDFPRESETCRYEVRIAVCGGNEVMAIARDITGRKKVEDEIRRAKETLEARVHERTSQLAYSNKELLAEIKDRRQAQEELAVKLRYEEALSAFSQELIENPDPASAVPTALGHLLKASGTSFISVFWNYEDPVCGLCMRPLHMAQSPGVLLPRLPTDKPLSYDHGISRWRDELSQNRAVQGTVDTFPPAERAMLEEVGILSTMNLPLRVEERWIGFIGFCDVHVKREWTGEDMRSLKLVAEVLGMYFQRQKVIEELEKANYDLRETYSRLTQSEKMASLGMLVAGIAHEINTPLGAINSMRGTSNLALEKLQAALAAGRDGGPLPAPLRKPLAALEEADKVMASATERVIGIVKRLRSFARLDEAELQRADLREGLDDTLAIIQHEYKRRISIVKEYGDIPAIPCFPNRLNQVFLNLLVNAIQSIKGNGTITLSTSRVGGNVHVRIADTGGGIPEANLHRIFDPGFTTKGVGVGTGLGLSICYQIIADHRGEIRVESRVGQGTAFTVILPIAPAAQTA